MLNSRFCLGYSRLIESSLLSPSKLAGRRYLHCAHSYDTRVLTGALVPGGRVVPAVLRVQHGSVSVFKSGSVRFLSTSRASLKEPKESDGEVKNSESKPGQDNKLSKKEENKLTVWQKVKHEAQHYWDGTKLLGYEIKVSTKLAAKMAAGYDLTRRESRQLRRTVQDMVRLVPFSFLIIIPFAELLLPVIIRLFPNFLPSTYESGKAKELKSKRLRKTRGAVSQFLRSTVAESVGNAFPTEYKPEQKEQFLKFYKQMRTSGETPSKELLISVARVFKDDTVLDNLSRPQLVAMARYMNLQPYGTNLMLRYSIRYKLRQIKRDDNAIDYEGVESLSVTELQTACASRGIRTYGVSPARLRDNLATWLELRLQQKVPSTLLLLSSAYSYGETENSADLYYDGLTSVLSALPEEVYHEAELELSPHEVTNKQRLEVFKEQEELIQDENLEEDESGHVIKVKDDISIDEEQEQAARDAEAGILTAKSTNTVEELVKTTEQDPAYVAPQDSTEYEPTEQELEKREEAFRDIRPQDSLENEPTPEEMAKRDEAFRDIRPQDSLENEPTPEEMAKRDEAFSDIRPQDSLENEPTPEEMAKRDEAFRDIRPQDSLENEPTPEEMAKRDEAFSDVRPQDSLENEPTPEEMAKRDEAFSDVRPQDSLENEPTPEEMAKRDEAFSDVRPQDSLESEPTPDEMAKRDEAFKEPTPEEKKSRKDKAAGKGKGKGGSDKTKLNPLNVSASPEVLDQGEKTDFIAHKL